MSKEFEALDKLEECAEGMKDLPKSNWIDLAENEAELDEKIFSWVEEIKFELFKGKQALTELKAIKEANPSGALEKIGNLHSITKGCAISYTDEYKVIKQALLKAQEQEKVLSNIHDIISKYILELTTVSNKEELKTDTINAIIKEVLE